MAAERVEIKQIFMQNFLKTNGVTLPIFGKFFFLNVF